MSQNELLVFYSIAGTMLVFFVLKGIYKILTTGIFLLIIIVTLFVANSNQSYSFNTDLNHGALAVNKDNIMAKKEAVKIGKSIMSEKDDLNKAVMNVVDIIKVKVKDGSEKAIEYIDSKK